MYFNANSSLTGLLPGKKKDVFTEKSLATSCT